ncbi:exodeoxyribonuclease III [Kordiimonas sediminis]|uniref:Exodeoxyribonuclease III n=1 Tax=Kordiimonas sediminis TaxID=1735581 RepID=A0A919E3B7_9PROT|nr:exodeoxyribonuclease III [Kordiimonas sediminis]GHF15366.1 exodeoxyribonuclease III [Kordiimonas sediminis]
MRIITWNINSVRARLGIVEKLLTEYAPDVLCLQETKVQDHMFPTGFFEDLGYPHLAIHGQKSHHGVATASKLPFDDSFKIDWCGKGDARHIAVKLPTGQVVHNFYVPAGGDEPNPDVNEKFAHKLDFLAEMKEWSSALEDDCILVGDLNIAPYEEDVWDHKKLLKVVSHTPIETDTMLELIKTHDWVDVMREFEPLPAKLYSWWSYRARDWDAADKGRRLDHIWLSPSLKSAPTKVEVLRSARGWEKPSDHAPVLMDIDL